MIKGHKFDCTCDACYDDYFHLSYEGPESPYPMSREEWEEIRRWSGAQADTNS